MPGEPVTASNPPNPTITRLELLRRLWSVCDQLNAAVGYRLASGNETIGWVQGQDDVPRALKAFMEGRLGDERFESVNQSGTRYTITDAGLLGLVLHDGHQVSSFCIDLDDHKDDGGNIDLLPPLARFFGASPVVFTSKGGKGLHCFFWLREPMPVDGFLRWSKAWGFNRKDEPELFPKTSARSQVWMPGAPNGLGGDTYVSGDFDSAMIDVLPEAPVLDLTTTALHFLRGQVTQPGRNAALNVAAMHLGQKGVDRAAAGRLCQRGAMLCGLDPGETKLTFDSGYNAGCLKPLHADSSPAFTQPHQPHQPHHPPSITGDFELDGIGNGERFVSMHGQDARYCYKLDEWYIWDTIRWAVRPDLIEAMAKLSARSIDDQPHRKRSSSKRGVDEILSMARSEPGMGIDINTLDGDPMLFNCMNGTIDLKTGTLRKHDRRDMLTKISPLRFDENASCPRWIAFLDRIFAGDTDLISYMQRAAGYSLSGDTSEQCLFFMHGLGCNGKSVFASVLLYVMGDYGQRAPAELIMKSGRTSPGGASPDIARLRGTRLVVTSELEEDQRFGEAQIKNLTGGDRIVARSLYKDPIEFDATHKLLLYGNHKPSISGMDHGIWRRMRLIPFEVTIPESERDPHLIEALKEEASGILAWMVAGCLAWQQERLIAPRAVTTATHDFRGESDQVGRFLDECCTQAAGVYVAKGDLFHAYQRWGTQHGDELISQKAFGQRMSQRGFKEKRLVDKRMWIGLEIKGGSNDA